MISKEAIQAAFNYFKANAKSINQGISTKEKDYHLHVQDLTGVGMSDDLVLAAFLSLCSSVLEKPIQEQTAILGTMTIGGFISSIDNLSDILQISMVYINTLMVQDVLKDDDWLNAADNRRLSCPVPQFFVTS